MPFFRCSCQKPASQNPPEIPRSKLTTEDLAFKEADNIFSQVSRVHKVKGEYWLFRLQAFKMIPEIPGMSVQWELGHHFQKNELNSLNCSTGINADKWKRFSDIVMRFLCVESHSPAEGENVVDFIGQQQVYLNEERVRYGGHASSCHWMSEVRPCSRAVPLQYHAVMFRHYI